MDNRPDTKKPDLNKLFVCEEEEALRVLANEGTTIERTLDDRVKVSMAKEAWTRLFNLDPSFTPCDSNYAPLSGEHVFVRFIRKVNTKH